MNPGEKKEEKKSPITANENKTQKNKSYRRKTTEKERTDGEINNIKNSKKKRKEKM